MLTAIQGVVQNNSIIVQGEDISIFNGRTVTIIINDRIEESQSKQDKSAFFDAVGKINIDKDAEKTE